MQSYFKTIKDIPENKFESAVVRVDFNVPITDGKVAESFRIDETLPTLEYLHKKGMKLVLVSHLGNDGSESLRPAVDYLNQYINVVSASSIDEARVLLNDGNDYVMLPNIRSFPGEKENAPALAKGLAQLGQIFVNEAFSVSHRKHASVVGISSFLTSYGGIMLEKEVSNLSKAFMPEHPFVLILGGKKAETKTPLIEKFIYSADKIIMGGALANDFLAAKGYEVGKSVVSEKPLIQSDWLNNQKFVIPDDVAVNDGEEKKSSKLDKGDVIVDVGEKFIEKAKREIEGAKFIVWNGSFGICEKGFDKGTRAIAEAVISSGAFSIVGGGDTTAALDRFKLSDKFSFVSTGGGAMLDFLANGTLPGLEALKKS